jgi:hypothetical protein
VGRGAGGDTGDEGERRDIGGGGDGRRLSSGEGALWYYIPDSEDLPAPALEKEHCKDMTMDMVRTTCRHRDKDCDIAS